MIIGVFIVGMLAGMFVMCLVLIALEWIAMWRKESARVRLDEKREEVPS